MKAHDEVSHIVLFGNALPAHDQVFDLASKIADAAEALFDYVSTVRDEGQASMAVVELLIKIGDLYRVDVTEGEER